ncbi:hypothetical protein ACIHFE_30500 [Streptomyces sp. NPDC052396]|uniref:SbtR family transcriptional regulator n=1 Tax=Streptomyces sp. NPDC052396 TaxID=3365689 RepID=UPI0037D8A29A
MVGCVPGPCPRQPRHGQCVDHQLILNAADSLLTRAQQHGTGRADLTAGDLVQLITGIALSTARDEHAEQAHRLLALVLDAMHGAPRRSE